MQKLKVVVSMVHYPLSIGRYFIAALEKMDNVELKTVGPFTGNSIPWNGGMTIVSQHIHTPDIPMNQSFIGIKNCNPSIVEGMIGWDEVDLWINLDSNFCFSRPSIAKHVVTVAIDPHVLSYDVQRTQCDIFYNMQASYRKLKDRILYYAASDVFHYPEEQEKIYDVCLIGLQYANRSKLVERLRSKGLKVFYDLGLVYDDYRKVYNQSKIAISWSSKDDLIARVFEALAMNIPLVTNRVSDLSTHFADGEHLYVFDALEQAEALVHMALANYDDALAVSDNGYRKVKSRYLYRHRIKQILGDCGLI